VFSASSNVGTGNPEVTRALRRYPDGQQFTYPEKGKNRGVPRLFDVWKFGAGEAIRTLDPNLGKVVLYP
jgi:hypothetical protein